MFKNLWKAKRTINAFTLIELLVVIAIIAIIATLSVLALQSARERARDSKRIADIKQLKTALELYYNDANGYPPASAFVTGSALSYTDSQSGQVKTYINQIPSSPIPADGDCTQQNNSYSYSSENPSTYTISYCLGSKSQEIPRGANVATPAQLYGMGSDTGGESCVPDCSANICGTDDGCGGTCAGNCASLNEDCVNDQFGYHCEDTCSGNVSYGGEDYPISRKEDGKCWFDRNLNIGSFIDYNNKQADASGRNFQKYCSHNDENNCSLNYYGGFYQWHTAMALPDVCTPTYSMSVTDHGDGTYTLNCAGTDYNISTEYQGICPSGWHLPNNNDWNDVVSQNASLPFLLTGDQTGYRENIESYVFSSTLNFYPSIAVVSAGSQPPLYQQILSIDDESGGLNGVVVRCIRNNQ